MRKNCFVVFVKYPVSGEVKTRLYDFIPENKVVELYRCFIKDIFRTIRKTKEDFYVALNKIDYLDNFKKEFKINDNIFIQKGKDLGQKLHNAFIVVFNKKYDNCIITGSDIPEISIAILKKAIGQLSCNDAVIGPTYDGGYYLIGFNKNNYCSRIFEGIPWSTEKVFEKTTSIMNNKSLKFDILPYLNDIDVYDDVCNFFNRNKVNNYLLSIKYIHKNIDILRVKYEN